MDILSFLQMLLVLAFIIALAYLVLHKGVGSFVKKSQSNRLIQVKERIVLDPKRSLYLVEVDNQRFLIGGSDSSISLISKLTLPDRIDHRGVSHFYDKTSFSPNSKLQAES